MNIKSRIANILIGLGVLCFIWYLYLMFFDDNKGDDIAILVACVGAVLFPTCKIYKNGIESADITKGIIVAVFSLLINIVVILLIGPKGKDFIEKIFLTLASEPYHWLYLIMLLVSGISVVKKNKIGFWLTSILLGIIAPAIIVAIVYAILVVIAIIFLLLFGGSKGSSASRIYSSNTQRSSNNNSSPPRRSDDTTYYSFFIVWSDGVHAPYSCFEKYPKDVSAAKVASDLKKKFGSTAQLIDFHIHDPLHDSVLDYY